MGSPKFACEHTSDVEESLRQGRTTTCSMFLSQPDRHNAQIPSEHDLSYNNLLRSIERQTKLRFADDAKVCGDATTGA